MKTRKHGWLYSLILPPVLATALLMPNSAVAQEPFLGQLMLVGYNFCPRNWIEADGQLLPISQNSALFSLYGTTYGGDGRTTFALPDLRGRAPIHAGNGPGLQDYRLGSRGGSEALTQVPLHNHDFNVTNSVADKGGPGGKFLAAGGIGGLEIYHEGPSNRVMDPEAVGFEGDMSVQKRSPYLTMRWCVALVGVFPSRN